MHHSVSWKHVLCSNYAGAQIQFVVTAHDCGSLQLRCMYLGPGIVSYESCKRYTVRCVILDLTKTVALNSGDQVAAISFMSNSSSVASLLVRQKYSNGVYSLAQYDITGIPCGSFFWTTFGPLWSQALSPAVSCHMFHSARCHSPITILVNVVDWPSAHRNFQPNVFWCDSGSHGRHCWAPRRTGTGGGNGQSENLDGSLHGCRFSTHNHAHTTHVTHTTHSHATGG
jgi:hypothetical protein